MRAIEYRPFESLVREFETKATRATQRDTADTYKACAQRIQAVIYAMQANPAPSEMEPDTERELQARIVRLHCQLDRALQVIENERRQTDHAPTHADILKAARSCTLPTEDSESIPWEPPKLEVLP